VADVELLPEMPSSVASVVRRHGVASAELVRDAVVVQGDRLYTADQMRAYARANLAPLQAENERLRAEVAEWKRVAAAQAELHGEAEERAEQLVKEVEALRAEVERSERYAEQSERERLWAEARAERLAEALRVAAGELASIGDAIGHDHPEARRLFTLRANLISARLAAMPQEDRND
jgi:predicted O-linked N-acetylglucosamine transferase (SPINDLY family)